jgi:hypothetical protein
MIGNCLSCSSARVIHSGARAGHLWCFVKRNAVNPETVCQVFTEVEKQACQPHAEKSPQRVLVKSAVESQIETNFKERAGSLIGGFDLASALYPVAK